MTKLERFAKENPLMAKDIGATTCLAENARMRKLLGSAVRSFGRRKRKHRPVWGTVCDWFCVGSTTAIALCREFGIDPESGKPIKATETAPRDA